MSDRLPQPTSDLQTWLAARLREPLPPEMIRARFAPSLSYGRHFGPPSYDARQAAVLALLYPRDNEWYVPFIVRPDTMLTHAGQISFPGGMVEAEEASRDAAVRELEEEVGVAADAVEIVGSLSPLYVFVSNIFVTPWVAVASAPIVFRPCEQEVVEILEMPLAHLLDRGNYGTHRYRRGDLDFTAPHVSWGRHRIWGATSIMLAELVAVLAELPRGALEVGAGFSLRPADV